MPQGDKDKNNEFPIQKWLLRSPMVKYSMALYPKNYVTSSTVGPRLSEQ